MEQNNKPVDSCCADEPCHSGRRNRFFPGKRFTADTWKVEQDYERQRRQLLNRAVHGWGVVYGFRLSIGTGDRCTTDGEQYLQVDQGLALDACGRELLWVGTQCADARRVSLDDIIPLDKDFKPVREPGPVRRGSQEPSPWQPTKDQEGTCWLLRAHYAERLIAPVNLRDPCQCEHQDWDQVCETVVFSLQPHPREECCQPEHCDLKCECTSSHCCPECAGEPAPRGGCRCLCEHLTALDPNPDCCTLCALGKGLSVDLRHGVPLACVTLSKDKCEDWMIGAVTDDCGPRRLVKRNDLLFDLIRGCDLTHIEYISWKDWHRNSASTEGVDFQTFVDFFGSTDNNGTTETNFYVTFSGPVQVATVTRDAFTMTAIVRESEGGWGEELRVPLGVTVEDPNDTGLTEKATLIVDSAWLQDALKDNSRFEQSTARIEIEIRGDYLLDCNGQAVDANARGLSPAPTGNGTPGDTYVSTFLVAKKSPRAPTQNPNSVG